MRGAHSHDDYHGKGLHPKVKEEIELRVKARKTPMQIWEDLHDNKDLPEITYKQVHHYVKNNRTKLLSEQAIKTINDFKEVAQANNLLRLHDVGEDTTDALEHRVGMLAYFNGEFPSSANTWVPTSRFPSSTALPPIPHEATDLLAELSNYWEKATKWQVERATMEKELEDNIRAVENNHSAPFFLDLLKNLLGACGWNFKTNKFHTRELNVESFYRSYKLLTEDYVARARRQRFVVVYTTSFKLKQFLEFNMLQRDDVYKLLWNGYPVESGGTAENRQYILCYLGIKCHEDTIASEIVNAPLLLQGIYHLHSAV
ncbi:hypothetical protein CYMTET_49003 [Cymbomonas tetramitiformis]|uniref:Uncharacterized protein n=1 Tax=Cymbomonas tetramitiformis TaxID=36881 RepID=A0AAE0BSC0_9CHLO|nr:hypothetical protein CYMTET_49003 [Cymbomonas tetramitiformis]